MERSANDIIKQQSYSYINRANYSPSSDSNENNTPLYTNTTNPLYTNTNNFSPGDFSQVTGSPPVKHPHN